VAAIGGAFLIAIRNPGHQGGASLGSALRRRSSSAPNAVHVWLSRPKR